MVRRSPDELQTRQEICRAEFLVALARGLSREESAEVLRHRAAAQRLSLHAVALAVLSNEPTDELLVFRSPLPAPSHPVRHLYALRSLAAEEATATTSALAPQQGRHRAR